MTICATKIFNFLEKNQIVIEKHEVFLSEFSRLRYNLRCIIERVSQSDNVEAYEICTQFRVLLSEWLTAPVIFDEFIFENLRFFGDLSTVASKWGNDVLVYFEAALNSAEKLNSQTNPVRSILLQTIRDLRIQHKSFKIYCHRLAKPHFDSIMDPETDTKIEDDKFIHTAKDYRDLEPVDVLIKVGPLRAKGWGSVPDAIITSPRFRKLVQVVWRGCFDEKDFGYNPVVSADMASNAKSCTDGNLAISRILLQNYDNSKTGEELIDEDEFQLFSTLNDKRDKQNAVMIHLMEGYGILYPPHAQVLSFDPTPAEQEPLIHRLPGETLSEGMFIIKPLLDDVDLGGVQAKHGYYSKIWKNRLAEELSNNKNGLVRRLRNAGLNLINLRTAVYRWVDPPSTVIHAPQLMGHFKILIDVLAVDFGIKDDNKRGKIQGWQYAWNEIRRSRGEAIQAGVNEQEVIEEELMSIINNSLDGIRQKASTENIFKFQIPSGKSLQGDTVFLKIYAIETGFKAPYEELKKLSELSEIEKWRA